MKIMLVGDINLKQDLGFKPATAFDLVAAELQAADIRLGNLEGCFSDPGPQLPYKPFWHHVEPDSAPALDDRFDALSCANNVHYGDAIIESLALLDKMGIAHTGAGPDYDAARRPAIVESGGKRVGVLAYTSVFWPVGAQATKSTVGVATLKAYTSYEPNFRVHDMPGGPAVVHTWPNADDLEAVLADIRALRAVVDHVVVYFHWGYTNSPTPAEYQRTVGHAAIDNGADIVVGSSPHTPQGVEVHGNGVILHSMGNFIFGAGHNRQYTRTGLLAKAEFNDHGLVRVGVVPVCRNDDGQVEPLDARESDDGRSIAEFVVAASAALGTETAIKDGVVEVTVNHTG